jgi:hypothetical protein
MAFMDIDQHDIDWLKMRTGCTTASRIFDIVDRLKVKSKNGEKGDYKASRRSYMIELICERLTGRASEHYVSDWMSRGIEDEDLARAAYERYADVEVTNGGFFLHDTIEYFGASPDGCIGDNGLLELKNYKPENHYEFLRSGVIPERAIWQMNAQLACAPEREYVDFGSYCKEMLSPKLRLFVRRHLRDRERVAEVETEVKKFNAELAYELVELTGVQPTRKEESHEEGVSCPGERPGQEGNDIDGGRGQAVSSGEEG